MNAVTGPGSNPRQRRLALDRKRMELVQRESEYVKPTPVIMAGSEPEKYIVTFHCRGIIGIDANREPIFGDRHEVEIYCDSEYPAEVPKLKWLTPIWHPNIQHREPKAVCVNKAEWLAGRGLDHLCWQLFDMVQYKNYHAEMTPPYPLDSEAAAWVRDFAEPRGVVNKRRRVSVDDKPFFRPQSRATLDNASEPPPPRRKGVRFLDKDQDRQVRKEASHELHGAHGDQPTPSSRVRFVKA